MNRVLLFWARVINRLFNYSYGRKKYFKAWKYLHTIALQGMGRIQGNPVEKTGEKNVLQEIILSGKEKVIILDVGANKGQYTSLALSRAIGRKKLELHLFEPSALNIGILQKNFTPENYPGCSFTINHLALSDQSGFAFLYTDSEGSDLGSLLNLKIPIRQFEESRKEEVQTMTLDEYALKNDIAQVDLLKIDVEGAEYKVLTGALRLLEENRISNIQFEFGAGNITARIFFHDFWDMLHAKYDFFQVLSDGLTPIGKYTIDQEIFKTTNYFLSLKTGSTK